MQMEMFGRAGEVPGPSPEDVSKAALLRLSGLLAREGPLRVTDAMVCVGEFMACCKKWSGVKPGPGQTRYPWAARVFRELLMRESELGFMNTQRVALAYHRSAANIAGISPTQKQYHWDQYHAWEMT